MAEFKLFVDMPDGGEKFFLYDNIKSTLKWGDTGGLVVKHEPKEYEVYNNFVSVDSPGSKNRNLKALKISLGLSCNYECSYCSQRFVPHAGETNKNDVEPFLNRMSEWFDGGSDGKGEGVNIQFWGGEPFVYIKTMKPLAEGLKARYPNAQLSVITNGSLLTTELNEWLEKLDFWVSISHDGPGQHVRGPDPFKDEENFAAIMDLYNRLHPKKMISINAMLNKHNNSRVGIQEYMKNIFGDDVEIGEGGYIDAYDEGGLAASPSTPMEQIYHRMQALSDIRSGGLNNFNAQRNKLLKFIESLSQQRDAYSLKQKCGMDNEDVIAVTLTGDVLTCQNTTAGSVAPNGKSHKIGSVYDFDNIKLDTSTHWSNREECPKCPVLQLCKGSCMYLEGQLWDASCDSAFSDNVAFLVGAVELMTGFTVTRIEGPQRADRQDIWVASQPKRKVIPIFASH